MNWLNIDFESRSAVDLKRAGAHRYWMDETTRPWGMSFAFQEGEPGRWMPGQPLDPRVVEHVRSGAPVSAWNAAFEFAGWNGHCVARHGFPELSLEQLHDTAAWGAAMNLPRNLGDAAQALNMPHEKDAEGRRLMLRMAKPRKLKKGEAVGPDELLWHDDPEDIERLMSYCDQDVRVERAIQQHLIPISPTERQVWLFDQRMNNRGVKIDMPLVNALQRIIEEAGAELDARIAELTGGKVTATSQVKQIKDFLNACGLAVDSLSADKIALFLAGEIPPDTRGILEARQEAAKTSTAKLAAMRDSLSAGDRVRGAHLWHGASTGRWAGRLIQPQNFARGTKTIRKPEDAVEFLMTASARDVQEKYGAPFNAVSDMLRSCLVASRGHRLLAADYSSIEGRVTAWLAGETWKLDAFQAHDEKRGPGIYELTAASIFNCDVNEITEKDDRRQVGKGAELGLGFGGGVLAFQNFSKADMGAILPTLRASLPAQMVEQAEKRYAENKKKGAMGTRDIPRDAWIASELTKVSWREKHPATAALWRGLEDAVIRAVTEPGSIASYQGISYIVRRGFLWCLLPSKRCLAYAQPEIRTTKTSWGKTQRTVSVMGVDAVTKKWRRYDLYGGILTENVVQAIARDLIAHGMLKADSAGYPIVLTVHDEAVADVPNGFGSLDEFMALLCDLPDWAKGLPLRAAGYEALRYKKD